MMNEWLARLDRWVARFEAFVATAALVISVAVSLYTIIARVLLAPTSEWVLELPMELLVVTAIYGSGVMLYYNGHLQVDFVVNRLPLGLRRGLAMLVQAGLAVLGFFLAERGAVAAWQAAQAGLRMTQLFDIPAALPMAVASVGFAFWGLHCSLSLFQPVPKEGLLHA